MKTLRTHYNHVFISPQRSRRDSFKLQNSYIINFKISVEVFLFTIIMCFEFYIFCSREIGKKYHFIHIFNLNKSYHWSCFWLQCFYSLYIVYFDINQLVPSSTCTCIAKRTVADLRNIDDTRRRTKMAITINSLGTSGNWNFFFRER